MLSSIPVMRPNMLCFSWEVCSLRFLGEVDWAVSHHFLQAIAGNSQG